MQPITMRCLRAANVITRHHITPRQYTSPPTRNALTTSTSHNRHRSSGPPPHSTPTRALFLSRPAPPPTAPRGPIVAYDPTRAVNSVENLPSENIVLMIDSLSESYGPMHDLQQHPLRYRGWNSVLRPHYRPPAAKGNEYSSSKQPTSNTPATTVDYQAEIWEAIGKNGVFRNTALNAAISKAPPEYIAMVLLGFSLVAVQHEYSDGRFGDFDFDQWFDEKFKHVLIFADGRMGIGDFIAKMENNWEEFEDKALAESYAVDSTDLSWPTRCYMYFREVWFTPEMNWKASEKEKRHEYDRSQQQQMEHQHVEFQNLAAAQHTPSALIPPHLRTATFREGLGPQDKTVYEHLRDREAERDVALQSAEDLRARMVAGNNGMRLTGSQEGLLTNLYRDIAVQFQDLNLNPSRLERLVDQNSVTPSASSLPTTKNTKITSGTSQFDEDYARYARVSEERELQSQLLQQSDKLLRRAEKLPKTTQQQQQKEPEEEEQTSWTDWVTSAYKKITYGGSAENKELAELAQLAMAQPQKKDPLLHKNVINNSKLLKSDGVGADLEKLLEKERQEHATRFQDDMRSDVYGVYGPAIRPGHKVSQRELDELSAERAAAERKAKKGWWGTLFGDAGDNKDAYQKEVQAHVKNENDTFAKATLRPAVDTQANPFNVLTERELREKRQQQEQHEKELMRRRREMDDEMNRALLTEHYNKSGTPLSRGGGLDSAIKSEIKKEQEHEKHLKDGLFGRLWG